MFRTTKRKQVRRKPKQYTMGRKRAGQVRKDGVLSTRILKRPVVNSAPMNYAKALIAPIQYAEGAARIPDLVLAPTQTTTLQLECTVSANSETSGSNFNAGGALLLTSNGPRYFTEGGTGASPSPDTSFGFVSLATANSNTWAGNVANGNVLLPGAYALSTTWSGYRIVGAGLQVEFLGNDANNQGQITGIFYTSIDQAGTANTILTSQAALENYRGNYTGAAKNGALLRYIPQDVEDLVIGDASTPTNTQTSRRWGLVNASSIGDTKNYGCLQWHATNLASASVMFRVTMRVHLEGLVSVEYAGTDTGEVTSSPEALNRILPAAALQCAPQEAMDVETGAKNLRVASTLDEYAGFQSNKKTRGYLK